MKTIKVKDREFELFIEQKVIEDAIEKVAKSIEKDYVGKAPLFLCVLNGSFMFAAELMKRMKEPCEISFVKFASYEGTTTVGNVKNLIGINEDISGRHIIIIEDIVDTGYTMERILKQLHELKPANVSIATLLLKPDALKVDIEVDYVALSIPPEFIIGYGLDYDGYARNLTDIYKVVEK